MFKGSVIAALVEKSKGEDGKPTLDPEAATLLAENWGSILPHIK
jgi:hypothetical protein